MRKSLVGAGIVLSAAAALSVGIGVAQAGQNHQAATVSGHRTTVVERAITDATTDTGKTGDSAGDVLTFANPIYGPRNKHRVGRDNGYCIRTKAGAAYECTWTTFLRGGSIVVTGPFYDTSDSVLAITGGTGRYASVHGQMLLHARNAKGTAYDFTFVIR